MLKDVYDIGRDLFGPVGRLWDKHQVRRALLSSFADEFTKYGDDIATLLPYRGWNSLHEVWHESWSELRTTSFNELRSFWLNPDLFVTYEAFLLRFARSGGTVLRVCIAGSELASYETRVAFVRAGLRQFYLGFQPHVASFLDCDAITRALGVDADMFCAVDAQYAYFLRMQGDGVILRIQDSRVASRVFHAHRELSRAAVPFERWYRQNQTRLQIDLREHRESVQREVELVEAIEGRVEGPRC